jgi:glucose/arabinose dehydrogenase
MKRLWPWVVGVLIAASLFLTGSPAKAAALNIGLQSFATGLSQPIYVTNSGISGDTRMFVVQRAGAIRIVNADGSLVAGNFLDISSSVSTAGEGGLLSVAFHPSYASNGYFYVYFVNTSGSIQVNRYTATGTPATATATDTATALPIITIAHPGQTNHYGGTLAFGPGGYLYLATGDGGSANDPPNNAQNINSLLGKVLRLDINSTGGGNNYVSPAGNPYLGIAGADEIWDIGLRNPFRISFDRGTGDLYIGDVGQSAREEVDRHPAAIGGGLNFGWRCYEGTPPNPEPSVQCNIPSRTSPIGEYTQAGTRAVTGGVVYRGSQWPALTGHYLFIDFYSANLYTLTPSGGGWEQRLQNTFSGRNLASFGENKDGEVFATDLSNGTVYRVTGTFQYAYSAQWAGQSAYPTIGSGEQATVYLDYRNTGTQTWSTGGGNPVRLGTSHPMDRASGFYSTSWLSPTRPTSITGQVNSGTLDTGDTSIEPGQIARFRFTVTGTPFGGNFNEFFQPVAEGATWMEDQSVFLGVTNQAKSYQYSWTAQTYPPSVMTPGTQQAATLDIQNTGTATWRRDTLFPLRLGASHPRDRSSAWSNGTWLSANRIGNFAGQVNGGTLDAADAAIEPGQTARFSFDFKAPATGGTYQEFAEPLVEHFAWLGSVGIFWQITVPSQAYDYQYIGQTAHPTVTNGGTSTVKLQVRNIGSTTWQSNGATPVRLGTDHPRDRGSGFAASGGGLGSGWLSANRIKLTRNLTDAAKNVGGETSIASGEVGEFEFVITGNPPDGAYKEYFTPVADGVNWMRDIGIFWFFTVQ